MINPATAITLALGLHVATSDAFFLRRKTRAADVPKFTVGATWQIVLRSQLKIPPSKTMQPNSVNVWDIDLFENTKNGTDPSTIKYLKGLTSNTKVICYFSAGSYEVWRTDWPKGFDNDNYGSPLDGWPGEYWLNINNTDVQEVMFKRIRLAAEMGCDAVDPDNVDGYVRCFSPVREAHFKTEANPQL